MKNQIKLITILVLLGSLSACNKKAVDPSPVVDTTPEYQKAIDAKFKAIGWAADGHVKFNNSNPVKTTASKGYVQYYAFGDRKTAIYYSDKGAFAMDTEEMKAYDAAGQDNFGTVVSDPKATVAGGCGYNDIITLDGKEAIITCQNLVYGNVYAKYKELGRWNSPLGIPLSSEKNTPAANPAYAKGRYNDFKNGAIWSFSTGTYGLWGRMMKLYAAQDWERGWLKLPTESCDPNKADNKQFVRYQGGNIDGADCGTYTKTNGVPVLVNGTVGLPPCYY
jgi:hypothetical protein